MVKSMTGYGKAAAELLCGGSLIVEIRTLNGKTADINIKSNLLPKEEELAIRSKLAARLQRGTIDVFITLEQPADKSQQNIDADVLKGYYAQIKELAGELGVKDDVVVFQSVLRFPDVVGQKKADMISEGDIPAIEKAFDEAIDAVDAFRTREGSVLREDVLSRVDKILALYDEVEAFEPERIAAVRAKLTRGLEEFLQKADPLRFEQEMIFYIEKLDINEEKVRLRQHCKYFRDTVDSEEYPGKKLGFIIQEMGREINTTGSKANHAGIQKCVVKMKDELEKMREQSMNIL